MDNSDTGIIGGMSKLVNQKNIKEGVDPQEIEDQLVKRPPTQDPKYDGMNKFISSLKDTAEDAGVEISSVSEAPPAPLQITNILNENLGRSKITDILPSAESSISSSSESGPDNDQEEKLFIPKSQSPPPIFSPRKKRSSYRPINDGYSTDEVSNEIVAKMTKTDPLFNIRRQSPISDFRQFTDEQKKQARITDVVSQLQNSLGSVRYNHKLMSETRTLDTKKNKLEQISQLKRAIIDEGISCEGVEWPTLNSSLEEIESTLQVLRIKNDRNRYSTLAEELIIGGAQILGTVFDGTREIPILGCSPDYTGYSDTVEVKLNRMRLETSEIVGDMVEKFNINPLMRVGMSLLPSFILYPQQKARQKAINPISNISLGNVNSAYLNIQKSENNS
uniref:PACV238 homolog protein n=1 Tax=Abalone asfa-like virus TaxID=2839893 RepID=A0A5K7XYK9_9VIRU|nr:PACV238 homolog protein [Abalone asfa-like virus]BCY04572.1 hypothetical protein [Abalone asfa-like virus]